MDIYFKVIDYNLRKNTEERPDDWNSNSIQRRSESPNGLLIFLSIISIILFFVSPFNSFSILYLGGYAIYFLVSKVTKFKSSNYGFDTTLHFTDEGITFYFYEASENTFEYTNISELTLHFHGVKNDNNENLSFFSWSANSQKYKYYISVDSEYPKSQLIQVLKFLYKNQIPIKELNAAGKEMKFLSVLENKMTAKTEKAYLNLIENIGKENEIEE